MPNIKNLPEKIYLQLGEINNFDTDLDFKKDFGEVTWCYDKINDHDAEYVLVPSLPAAASIPFDENKARTILKNKYEEMISKPGEKGWEPFEKSEESIKMAIDAMREYYEMSGAAASIGEDKNNNL